LRKEFGLSKPSALGMVEILTGLEKNYWQVGPYQKTEEAEQRKFLLRKGFSIIK